MSAHRHADPLLRRLEAPLRAVFYPFGFRLEIESNDRRVLECAESSFGIFRRDEFSVPPLRLRLMRAPDAAACPPWPAPAYRAWGDLFAVVCGPDNFLTADLDRRQAFGFFSPAMLEDREFFRWTFLDCATYTLLGRHHLTPIHAAGVAREGFGICLCGPAGAGKTSLAYCCARAGDALLADDVVHILRSGGAPQLRGNPSRLHFAVSARELFPELQDAPVTIRRDGGEFLALPAEQLLPGRVATQAEPGALVFLQRSAEPVEAALEPILPSEALKLLTANLPMVDEERTMAQHYAVLERLARDGAYRLRYSTLEEARRQLDLLPLPERTQK